MCYVVRPDDHCRHVRCIATAPRVLEVAAVKHAVGDFLPYFLTLVPSLNHESARYVNSHILAQRTPWISTASYAPVCMSSHVLSARGWWIFAARSDEKVSPVQVTCTDTCFYSRNENATINTVARKRSTTKRTSRVPIVGAQLVPCTVCQVATNRVARVLRGVCMTSPLWGLKRHAR